MTADHVVSTRFDGDFLAEIRKLAAADGQTVSDWLRDAAWRKAHGEFRAPTQEVKPAGWGCQHMTMTASVPLTGVRASCGCQMQPYYAPRAA